MSKVFSAALLAALATPGGPVEGKLESVSAGAVSFAQTGSLKWVKAKEAFLAKGSYVAIDDFAEIPEADAKWLVSVGRAEDATAEDVAAAQQKASKK